MYLLNTIIFCILGHSFADNKRFFYTNSNKQLKTLIEVLIDEFAENSQCIVSLMDTYYRRKADVNQIIGNNYLPMYRVLIRDNEEFAPPRKRLLQILKESKYVGCDVYLIFMANGLQVANFLQYAEEERLISTQGKFLLIYDFRIFHTDMRYLWNRIINVIFLRHYVEFKRHSKSQLLKHEWYDLNTIPFPARTKGLVITKYIDTWYQNRFRYGISHFSTKIDDLKKQKLRVAVFEHLPAVTTDAQSYFKSQKGINANSKPLGIEFEMLLIIANVLNFKPYFYEPHNIKNERWGDIKNGTLTGILGETQKRNAVFYLGDLYYTMRHLELLDLSWPYNTECLTFLTLESLTENSWKLLILPFRLYTWIAVIFTLLAASITFFMFSRFYKYHIGIGMKSMDELNTASMALDIKNFTVFEKARSRKVEEYSGLYLFTELQNCILYTLSMLLQVSLPLLPSAWSLRILIGWWWIFTILITVTYRASMTASLANSIDRVTIDTIAQLVKSSTVIGSWSDEMKDFFINSSDVNLQRLSNRFIVTMDEQDAIAAVANGTLSYYENVHVLKYERVKRQILEVELQKNDSQENKHKFLEHNLHIMEECVINMPISLGMDKHSPLKGPVDKMIKRIMEAGFVKKWLSDITQQSKILELRQEGTVKKLLIDLDKLQGAVVSLGFGYIIGIIALVGEIWYWKYIVLKNPNYNKYRKELFYKKV